MQFDCVSGWPPGEARAARCKWQAAAATAPVLAYFLELDWLFFSPPAAERLLLAPPPVDGGFLAGASAGLALGFLSMVYSVNGAIAAADEAMRVPQISAASKDRLQRVEHCVPLLFRRARGAVERQKRF